MSLSYIQTLCIMHASKCNVKHWLANKLATNKQTNKQKRCHHWQSRGKTGSIGLKKQTERKQTKKQAPLA